MNEFDLKAAEWDNNPLHTERSKAVAGEIVRLVPLNKDMSALEYGAGTGVTAFLLKDYLKGILMMDNSAEMVKVINSKIDSSKAGNLRALYFNLEENEYKDGKFDLIYTQLVLHHVIDIEKIITDFYRLLNPGGYLVIADLYEENGSFHGDGFTGHNGFNIEALSGILIENHFMDIFHKTCFIIDRMISETETKKFEVFIMTSKRD